MQRVREVPGLSAIRFPRSAILFILHSIGTVTAEKFDEVFRKTREFFS
jgi:hypothetical protein